MLPLTPDLLGHSLLGTSFNNLFTYFSKEINSSCCNAGHVAVVRSCWLSASFPFFPHLQAHASVEITTDKPIRLPDVQSLVLWVLAEPMAPRWVFVRNKPLLQKVVLVQANGLNLQLYEQYKEMLPNLQVRRAQLQRTPNACPVFVRNQPLTLADGGGAGHLERTPNNPFAS